MYVKYLYLFLFPETYCRYMYFCSMVFSLVLFLLHVCAVITLQRLYCTLEQSPSKSSSIYIQYRDSSLRDNATRCFTSNFLVFFNRSLPEAFLGELLYSDLNSSNDYIFQYNEFDPLYIWSRPLHVGKLIFKKALKVPFLEYPTRSSLAEISAALTWLVTFKCTDN